MIADKDGWAGGEACLPAAEMALEDVNKNPTLLKGYELNMTWYDSQVKIYICGDGTSFIICFH